MSGRRFTAALVAALTFFAAAPAWANDPSAAGERATAERPGATGPLGRPGSRATAPGAATAALSGPWHIRNRHSGQCLTIHLASTAENAPAVQYPCDYTYPYNEEWYFDGYHIINGHSGKCLTIHLASMADNAGVVQYTCDSSPPFNEDWLGEDLSPVDDWIHIVNYFHSGKCLTIHLASTAWNARAVQYTCDYSYPYNEEWYLEPLF